MLILGLLDMYFDAAVVFVTNSSLLFRLAVAILWLEQNSQHTFCYRMSIVCDFDYLKSVNLMDYK